MSLLENGETTIAGVRGELAGDRADQAVAFLAQVGGLNEDAARRRASEAVCVEREGDEIIGVSSVRPRSLQLVGGLPFWIYQSVLSEGSDERWNRMFMAAFDALAVEFERSQSRQVGLCVLVDDPAEIKRRSEAVWPDSELMLAGYLDDGRQVRIRYFRSAEIGPGLPDSPSAEVTLSQTYPLEDRYRIQSLAESSEIGPDDVRRFWIREGAILTEEEARRRVQEVQLVAVEREDGVVGVSTLYLQRNPQLRIDLWHFRTYVARAHRKSNIAAQLMFGNRDLTEGRFVSGEDTRAVGMLFELENEGLKRYMNKALWPGDFTFIGENEQGDHVRVHYFPGARVPASAPATAG